MTTRPSSNGDMDMQEFDYDGFHDGADTLDDGFDHGDEFAEGFQPYDPDIQNDANE